MTESYLDRYWAALEAHTPKPEYADAWAEILARRTAVPDVPYVAPEHTPEREAAIAAMVSILSAEWAASFAEMGHL
jgi:hypothetical protein